MSASGKEGACCGGGDLALGADRRERWGLLPTAGNEAACG